MSAEIGGGLVVIPLLLSALGHIIAAAVTVVVVGAAVLTAGAALVGIARGVNALAQKAHQRRIQQSIDKQNAASGNGIRTIAGNTRENSPGLAQQIAAQRQRMLNMYTSMSAGIDEAARYEEEARRNLISQAQQMNGNIQKQVEKTQENLRIFNQRTEQQLQNTISQVNTEIQSNLQQWNDDISTQLSARKKQFEKRISNIVNLLERDRIGLEYASDLYSEAQKLHSQLL